MMPVETRHVLRHARDDGHRGHRLQPLAVGPGGEATAVVGVDVLAHHHVVDDDDPVDPGLVGEAGAVEQGVPPLRSGREVCETHGEGRKPVGVRAHHRSPGAEALRRGGSG